MTTHNTMKARTLFSGLVLISATLFISCSTTDAGRPPDKVERVSEQPQNNQVLSAQEPTHVLSANLSHHELQVIQAGQAQHAQFASQTEAPCDTCGNGIWGVFALSGQAQALTAFIALLVLSAAFYMRRQRYRRVSTIH